MSIYIYVNNYDMSCGVRTIGGTSHPRLYGAELVENLRHLANMAKQHSDSDENHDHCAAFYLGSDVRESMTEVFFNELANIGTVHRSTLRKNPNTGNMICIWTWMPGQKKMVEWMSATRSMLPSVWAKSKS
jgi:hypothetical protein